ncbi:MAG: metallophosphoesterase [Lentisphaeria bacterium]|nr:metallophosphoesterase [Lentisphaeria bacterium]
MGNSTGKQTIYGKRASVLRKFYFSDPAALNFCNVWHRLRKNASPAEFFCTEPVRIPVKGKVTFRTFFTAEKNGIALLGIACRRKFTVFCNDVFCCSTLDEGTLYDDFAPENHPFPVPVKKGVNVLEVHLSPGTEEAYFLCRVLEKNKFKAPFLPVDPVIGHPDHRALSITVRTFGGVGTALEYRKKGAALWQMLWDHNNGLICRRPLHKFFLYELESGREYEFRVVMIDPADPDKRSRSKKYSFHVPGDENCSRFSFFFTADTQYPSGIQKQLLQGVLSSTDAKSCDFLVFGGDINSRYSTRRVEEDLISTVQKTAGSEKPLVMLRGNHELRGPEPDSFLDQWGDENNLTYRLFRYGDTAFLMLDAWENRCAEHPKGRYYSRHNLDRLFMDQEKEFIRKAVHSEKWYSARRRIVLAHGAPYSHHDKADTMFRYLQEMTDAFFSGKEPFSKVDLWLAGHTHRYTRSIPQSRLLTAFCPPPAPQNNGENYIFPVLTVCGPNAEGMPPLSAFRVDAFENGELQISSHLPDGTIFEKIRITANDTIEEILSLPCYDPEP